METFHQELGHIGTQKMTKELDRRFIFPAKTKNFDICRKVKKECVTCQACEPPNWNMSLPLSNTPVPDYIMTSVSLDIFALPNVLWQGQNFDQVLICIDRLSGWIIARPCKKIGVYG